MTTSDTTADKLAAMQLIEKHGLTVLIRWGEWKCEARGHVGLGKTLTSSVKDWAIAAGVEWPAVKVVPMFAVVRGDRVVLTTESESIVRALFGDEVKPCEVVIRDESEGV